MNICTFSAGFTPRPTRNSTWAFITSWYASYINQGLPLSATDKEMILLCLKKKRKNAFESHAVYNAYQSTLRDSASCFYKLTKSLLLSSFPFFRHLQIWSCVAILLISIFISYVLIYGGNIHYKRAFLTVLTARENVQDTGFIALHIHWIKKHTYLQFENKFSYQHPY